MGTPMFILRPKNIGAMSTPLGIALAMTKESDARKPSFLTITERMEFKFRVARNFNTYGPRMHPNDGRVVTNFIVQALRNAPITIYGDGSQTRSFCYVDDLIVGFLILIELHANNPKPKNQNNPNDFSIAELAEKVIELTG